MPPRFKRDSAKHCTSVQALSSHKSAICKQGMSGSDLPSKVNLACATGPVTTRNVFCLFFQKKKIILHRPEFSVIITNMQSGIVHALGLLLLQEKNHFYIIRQKERKKNKKNLSN